MGQQDTIVSIDDPWVVSPMETIQITMMDQKIGRQLL